MTTDKCPYCGRGLNERSVIEDRELLLAILGRGDEEVYRADQTDRWFVTHGRGEVSRSLLRSLINDGTLRQKYSNTKDSYWLGRTWDVDRTLEARKRLGKGAPDYYVGDP